MLQSDVCPMYEVPPHIDCPFRRATCRCNPSNIMPSFTHSPRVFLPLPTHLTLVTTTFLQADTQSSTPPLRSKYPNHLNLPHLTTSSTLWTPSIQFQRFIGAAYIKWPAAPYNRLVSKKKDYVFINSQFTENIIFSYRNLNVSLFAHLMPHYLCLSIHS